MDSICCCSCNFSSCCTIVCNWAWHLWNCSPFTSTLDNDGFVFKFLVTMVPVGISGVLCILFEWFVAISTSWFNWSYLACKSAYSESFVLQTALKCFSLVWYSSRNDLNLIRRLRHQVCMYLFFSSKDPVLDLTIDWNSFSMLVFMLATSWWNCCSIAFLFSNSSRTNLYQIVSTFCFLLGMLSIFFPSPCTSSLKNLFEFDICGSQHACPYFVE